MGKVRSIRSARVSVLLLLVAVAMAVGPRVADAQGSLGRKIDSIKMELEHLPPDTNRVNSLNRVSVFCISAGDYVSGMRYAEECLRLLETLGDTHVPKEQLMKMNTQALASTASAYQNMGNYTRAIEYSLKALSIDEKMNNYGGMGDDYSNIGIVYRLQGNYQKAMENYELALRLFEKCGNKRGIAGSHNNKGLIYRLQGKFASALDEYFISLRLKQQIGNKIGIATSLNNIGNIYALQGDALADVRMKEDSYDQSIAKQNEALRIRQELGDRQGIAMSYINIADVSLKKFRIHPDASLPARARTLLLLALEISRSIREKNEIKECYSELAQLYKLLGDSKNALINYKLQILYRDSLLNEANVRKQTQMEMQYGFDKKQAADSIAHAEQVNREEMKHRQEIKQQRIYTFGGAIAFVLMLGIVILSLRANREKQKANEIISFQKQLVEAKQKEILDSIYYARRIQRSLLPGEKYIDKKLREHLR